MDFYKKNFTFREIPFLKLTAVFSSLILFGMFISFTIAVMVEETSGEKFCGMCHTMTPVVNSYLESIHGGKNKTGFKAKCVSCHLPHDGLLNYLFTKARIGNHDVIAEIFYDKKKIDWHKMRTHRENYTYDSGCLKCHSNLMESSRGDHKAYIAHKSYFIEGGPKCVSCHESVGHKNLADFLNNRR